jgi:MFS family permease
VLSACAGIGAMIAFLQLVEELLASKGISDTTAGAMGALFVVGGAVGSFLISAMADRLGRHARVLAAMLVATAVGLLAMAAFREPLALCAVGVVVTAAVAATWPLSLTLSEELTGLATAGMSASVVLLFGNLAGVVLTEAMEQLHGSGGSFTAATVFLAAVCALGVIPAARIRTAPIGAPSAAT